MKIAVAIALALIVAFIGFMAYSTVSSNITMEYARVLQYSLASGLMTGGVKYVDESGAEHYLDTAGITKLAYYASYQPLWVMLPIGDESGAKYVLTMGDDTLTIMHGGKSYEDDAIICLDMVSINKSYMVKVHKDAFWDSLDHVMSGIYFDDDGNIEVNVPCLRCTP